MRGKRIRVAGWVRAEGLTGDAGLWLSVDGGGKPTLAFDNVNRRAARSRDWMWSEVVLDVPSDATTLSFGLGLGAAGQAWVNGLTVEEVDSSRGPDDRGRHLGGRESCPEIRRGGGPVPVLLRCVFRGGRYVLSPKGFLSRRCRFSRSNRSNAPR